MKREDVEAQEPLLELVFNLFIEALRKIASAFLYVLTFIFIKFHQIIDRLTDDHSIPMTISLDESQDQDLDESPINFVTDNNVILDEMISAEKIYSKELDTLDITLKAKNIILLSSLIANLKEISTTVLEMLEKQRGEPFKHEIASFSSLIERIVFTLKIFNNKYAEIDLSYIPDDKRAEIERLSKVPKNHLNSYAVHLEHIQKNLPKESNESKMIRDVIHLIKDFES